MQIKHFFTGVVEDVNDPLQLGRVRVRAFTYHSASQADIPTADLPWATCMMPVTSPGISGVGTAPVGLIPGSWVMGFFRDGDEAQDPVILGCFTSSSSSLSGERGNGFADPHGYYPNLLGPDIPAGATTYGYGANDGYRNPEAARAAFNTNTVGSGSTATSFHGPLPPLTVNGDVGKVINAARGEVGVIETSNNQGPGIAKYWSATTYPEGYNNAEPWCAAFVCYCIKVSGLFTETDRPKTASAFGYESWARSKSSRVTLTVSPTAVRVGDIVIFSFSHIGIVTSDSDINGVFRTIEGNTGRGAPTPGQAMNVSAERDGNGVHEKSRKLSLVRSAITIR